MDSTLPALPPQLEHNELTCKLISEPLKVLTSKTVHTRAYEPNATPTALTDGIGQPNSKQAKT
eukprot:429336-Amphidinium_carterae.1